MFHTNIDDVINQKMLLENWDTSIVPFVEVVKLWLIFGMEMNRDKETQLNGMIILIDCKGYTMKMATHTSFSVMHMIMKIFLVSDGKVL
jgi:hypothetical protein